MLVVVVVLLIPRGKAYVQSKQPHLLPSELLNPSVPDLPRTSGGAHFLEQNEMAHAEEVNRGTFPDLLDSDSRSAAQTEAFQLGLGSRTSQPGASPMFPATSPLLVRAAGMLRADEASAIVREAEEEGAASGWTSRYTYQKLSDDLHVEALPQTNAILADALLRDGGLLATAEAAFPGTRDGGGLIVHNAIVVRYNGTDAVDGGGRMPAHSDASLLTINIALTGADEFEGGGTWFQALDGGRVVRAEHVGDAIFHASTVRHSGAPTTQGTRYILTLFLHCRDYVDHSMRCQARALALLERGETRLAIASQEMAIAANVLPLSMAEQLHHLASMYRELGDHERALEIGRRAVQLGGLVGDTMFEAQLGVAHDLTRISCASAAMAAECGAVIDPHHRRRLWHIVRCWERAVKSSQRCVDATYEQCARQGMVSAQRKAREMERQRRLRASASTEGTSRGRAAVVVMMGAADHPARLMKRPRA